MFATACVVTVFRQWAVLDDPAGIEHHYRVRPDFTGHLN
jgi:hypothetical protein